MVKQQHGPASPACLYGTHHPRSTRAYNGHIFLEFRHFTSIPDGSGTNVREENPPEAQWQGERELKTRAASHQSHPIEDR
jgi:hypothetical protein